MKMNDIKSLGVNELNDKLFSLKKDLFTFLKQKATGQFENNFRIKWIKKDIARIKTYLKMIEK